MLNWKIFAWAFGTAAAVYKATSWSKDHMSEDRRQSVILWLNEEDESNWAKQFGLVFDALMGPRHLSWKRVLSSSVASGLAIGVLWLLFGPVLGLMGSRTDIAMPLGQLLLLGIAINLVADYASLIETRWLLGRFEKVRALPMQLGLLALDLVISAAIILVAISLFRLAQGQRVLSPVELLAGYTPYAIFFYSTFLTSVWAWAFCLSAWFIRLFTRLGLNRHLPVWEKPLEQIGLVAGVIVFLSISLGKPVIEWVLPENIDGWVCETFGGHACTHAARLSPDDKEKLRWVQIACQTGDPSQCKSVLSRLDDQLSAEALPYLRLACEDGGTPEACNTLGFIHSNALGVEKNHDIANAYFTKACDAGSLSGCSNLGVSFHNANGVAKDLRQAHDLYKRACDGGNMNGCANLGSVYNLGDGVEQDYQRARELSQIACDGGNMFGCSNLGLMYEKGHGVAQDYEAAFDLFNRACGGGQYIACSNLGVLLKNGTGVSQDYEMARAMFRKSCDNGEMQGCTNLGATFENGLGAAKDYAAAARLYDQACQGDNPEGCSGLGSLMVRGLGIDRDIPRGKEMLRGACEAGVEASCASLIALALSPRQDSDDLGAALQMLMESCETGVVDACLFAGDMARDGKGGPSDPARAKGLWRAACDGGNAQGCARLEAP